MRQTGQSTPKSSTHVSTLDSIVICQGTSAMQLKPRNGKLVGHRTLNPGELLAPDNRG